MDLDNFKNLNSKLTHLEADVILLCVARMIREVVSTQTYREKVVAGHIGGDKFMFTIMGHEGLATDFIRTVLGHFENLQLHFRELEVDEKFQEFKQDHGFSASVALCTWKWNGESSEKSSCTSVAKFKQAQMEVEVNARRANEALLLAKENKTRHRGGKALLWSEHSK
ncbi:hypothetical protein HPB48_026267 [Haemaphysalis longicornis]|uniref:GGDEF domain-containing protein n=1 Tax=Haemaphysalis longicornis TaxID=44386 RepID=A0A9J6HB24_HAELO|nr:hypothetical protein HPB48_026267 [Haemaphysalis longicornis]